MSPFFFVSCIDGHACVCSVFTCSSSFSCFFYLPCYEHALPENPNLPNVLAFAEYQNTDTRQRCALPSARTRALGKHLPHGMPELCRVLAVGNEWHSANCHLCRVLAWRHSANPAHVPSTRARRATPVGGGLMASSLCRVPPPGTRQRGYFAESLEPGSRQIFFCRVLELRYSAKLGKKNFLAFKIFWSLVKFDNLIPSNIKNFY